MAAAVESALILRNGGYGLRGLPVGYRAVGRVHGHVRERDVRREARRCRRVSAVYVVYPPPEFIGCAYAVRVSNRTVARRGLCLSRHACRTHEHQQDTGQDC